MEMEDFFKEFPRTMIGILSYRKSVVNGFRPITSAEHSKLEVNLARFERSAFVADEVYIRIPGRRPGARDIAENDPDPWRDDSENRSFPWASSGVHSAFTHQR